jgi:hypothetical protein
MALEYFTATELDELPNMSEGRYTTARKEAAAAYIVGIIERTVGTSFIARTVTDERHDGGTDAIVLERPYVLSVTSATEDGAAVTDTLRVVHGVVRRFSGATSFTPITWASGTGNVLVTYQSGYSSTVPADLKEAALQATRWRLMATNSNSDLNARQTSITNEMGGTVNYAVAGKDRPTGYPDVDAVIVGWRDELDVFGFA